MTAASINQATAHVCCPDCGLESPNLVGHLPHADFFAGRVLEPAIPGGALYSCNNCHLHFRWPRLSKQQMDELYEVGEDDNWTSAASKRRDWQIAAEWIQALPQNESILDIACFDGRFLESLPDRHQKYGVEIQPLAAERATQRGARIIADNFEKLDSVCETFSVITAFDILEHTHEPLRFLQQLSHRLQPGGSLIVGTGNSQAATWRLMGSDYWYCSTIEHISFINPKWSLVAGNALGMPVERLETLSHSRASVSKVCRETVMNLSYRAAPSITQTMLRRYRNLVRSKKRTTDCYTSLG